MVDLKEELIMQLKDTLSDYLCRILFSHWANSRLSKGLHLEILEI